MYWTQAFNQIQLKYLQNMILINIINNCTEIISLLHTPPKSTKGRPIENLSISLKVSKSEKYRKFTKIMQIHKNYANTQKLCKYIKIMQIHKPNTILRLCSHRLIAQNTINRTNFTQLLPKWLFPEQVIYTITTCTIRRHIKFKSEITHVIAPTVNIVIPFYKRASTRPKHRVTPLEKIIWNKALRITCYPNIPLPKAVHIIQY